MTAGFVAGFTFLFYIAGALAGMMLFRGATSANGIAAKLARVAGHASDVRIAVLLYLLSCVSALVLAVTLYGITRDHDDDLARLALVCRVSEGVLNAILTVATLGVVWLATARAGADAPDAAARLLGEFLLEIRSWSTIIGATLFAVGSTLFSYLLLRGRSVPVPLAWLGLVASLLVLIGLPLELVGFLGDPITSVMWAPMLVFEVVLGLWLLIRGVAVPAGR